MTVQTPTPLKPCVLRILNGPLQGSEFTLGEGTTLFVVATMDVLGDGALCASVPAEAIFIPLEEGGCNFEVLGDQVSLDAVPVRRLGDPVQLLQCVFQTRVRIGGLHIAVRPGDQAWAPGFLGQHHDAMSRSAGSMGWHVLRTRWAAATLTLVVLVAAMGLWSIPAATPESEIRALTVGANAETQVLRGRDHSVYVFVASERDAGWSRQVLARHDVPDGKVLLLDQERRRLEQVLIDHDPHLAWLFLDLKDPSVPRLLLSAQRNLLTPDKQAELLDTLLAAAPYARDIEVQTQDDGLLADLAQGGLQRLSLTFKRVAHKDSVTYAIEGDLQDSELAAARRYVDDFYRQWGDRYVHFTVELKDDALKGLSFQTGPQGYVKTNASSWHFLQHTE